MRKRHLSIADVFVSRSLNGNVSVLLSLTAVNTNETVSSYTGSMSAIYVMLYVTIALNFSSLVL